MAIMKDVITASGLTATGTVLADALQLNASVNIVATAAASTGVKLPPKVAAGTTIVVINNGANAMNVFPATATGTINGGGAGAAKSLAVTDFGTRSRVFVAQGADVWFSMGVA